MFAAVSAAIAQLLWIGGASASPSLALRAVVPNLSWAGGAVTLSVSGGSTDAKCRITVSPSAVVTSSRWACGPGTHRSIAHLPSNDTPHPVHYWFLLTPGNITTEVTVPSANHGSELRVVSQPLNAAVSADSTSNYVTATLSATATGSPSLHEQWYSSSVPGNWSPVRGATHRTLVVSAAKLSGFVVQYAATFSSRKDSVTTRPASVYEVTYGQKWAGYVDVAPRGRQFSSVSGSWTVPALTCGAATTEESTWVGIDGETNSTVEQAGSVEACQDGVPSYQAFYEMWGYASLNGGLSVDLPTSSDPVAPGDSVAASVSLANGQWEFTVDDTTAGWTSSVPIAQPEPAPAQSSAEWIVEAPQICESSCTTASLALTAPVTFSNAGATLSGVTGTVSSWPTQAFAIESTAASLDRVSALNQFGTSFTVAPTASADEVSAAVGSRG